jgi:hypothetical protein
MDGEREWRTELRGEARLDAPELRSTDEDEEGRVDGQRARIERRVRHHLVGLTSVIVLR